MTSPCSSLVLVLEAAFGNRADLLAAINDGNYVSGPYGRIEDWDVSAVWTYS